MKKISLTIDEVKFIWSLGFTTGRVQRKIDGDIGVGPKQEDFLFGVELERITLINKRLGSKLQRIRDEQQTGD